MIVINVVTVGVNASVRIQYQWFSSTWHHRLSLKWVLFATFMKIWGIQERQKWLYYLHFYVYIWKYAFFWCSILNTLVLWFGT